MTKKYKPIAKLDGGLLCNKCRKTIRYFKNEDEAQGLSGPVLCQSCLHSLVYNYKTRFKEGFTTDEEKKLIERFPTISTKHYFDALNGVTGLLREGEPITFHCDIFTALNCGLDHRNITAAEWD